MPTKPSKIKSARNEAGFFRFKKLGGKYLITNEIGQFVFLTPDLFKKFPKGKISEKTGIYKELCAKGFIKSRSASENLIQKYRQKNGFLFQKTSLFIVVPTLRCNHKCAYCQAGSVQANEKKYDMSLATAKKTVDFIFQTPSPVIKIEFQGGEPLMNWPVLKFIIEYAVKKNEGAQKNLSVNLVSNFSLLNEEKLRFLLKNKVNLTTSLDGPEKLHNKNRPWPGGNGHKETVRWAEKINGRGRLSAVLTVSKNSLKYPREIVDEYLKRGFREIHLRPLSYLGLSGKSKNEVGYPIADFINFWKKSLDYIISLNARGSAIRERQIRIMLLKIFLPGDPNYAELRSPCGAVTGQLAFNFDGKIYTCDEGRMIGEETFLLGDVRKDDYQSVLDHPTAKTVCLASLLENLPCDNCVYKPYCGVCPVQNYALYGDIFPQLAGNDRCRLNTFQFDYLFNLLENKPIMELLEKWLS